MTIHNDTICIKAMHQGQPVAIWHNSNGEWIMEKGCMIYRLFRSSISAMIESEGFTDVKQIRSGGGHSVAQWYFRIFHHDTINSDIPYALTFEFLQEERERLKDHFCMYDYLGIAADSIVRERLTAALDHPILIQEGSVIPFEAETQILRDAIAEKIDRMNNGF